MSQKRLLFISLLTIFLIFIFHYSALKYSWYWTYRWLDIPIHIVGGFWVSLTALWFCLRIKHIDSILDYKKKAFWVMLLSVLVIAILWEVYELIFNITSLDNLSFLHDSLGDVSNSLIGGLIAFFYFIKNKKTKSPVLNNSFTNRFAVTL